MTRLPGALFLVVLLTACAGSPATPTPSPAPAPTPSPSPAPGTGFYLRAWYTQALPPSATFSWMPMLTIVDGTLIDGNVAVPAIFPGPLMISPFARWISDAGSAAIVDEARRLGLLGDMTDFTGGAAMPGARLGQLELVIDGQRRVLTGDPERIVRCGGARCIADPGTPEAFAAFWQELANAETWLGSELGATVQYQPLRVALLLTAPQANDAQFTPAPVAWPFDTPLTEAGVSFPGAEGDRCVTLSGDALAAVLPTLLGGNQLTTFVDQAANIAAPVVRVLVPGEESPCPDGG